MKKHDFVGITICFAAAVICAVIAVWISLVQEECSAKGGILVRTVSGLECINVQKVKPCPR